MEPKENTITDCDYVKSNQDTTNDCDYVEPNQDTTKDCDYVEPNQDTTKDCDYVEPNQDTTNDCDLYVKSGQDTNNDVVLNTHFNKDTTNDCVLNENFNQNTNNRTLKSLEPQNHASESTLRVDVTLSTFDVVSPDLETDNVCPDEDKVTPLCESETKHTVEQSANSAIHPELLIHITSSCDDDNSIDDEDDDDEEDSFPSYDNSIVEDIESVASDNEKTEPAEPQGSPSFYIYMLAAFKPQALDQHLSRGGDVNAADSFGVTPLKYAQMYKHSLAIRKLIELGAKFSEEEEEKIVIDESFMFRQICGAAQSIEDPSLVILVCQVLGCPVDIRNEAGETPLMVAVKESNINAVQNLLKAGACVDDDVLLAAYDHQSMLELLRRKMQELATRDVTYENYGSSVDPICHTSSETLQSSTESTTSINDANQDLLSNRTPSNDVDNNQTENAVEVASCNIQHQDADSLVRDTSEIKYIQHVSLESQSETSNVEKISQSGPPETMNVENLSLESCSETRNVENISLESSSERRHVENVSQRSQIETGNVQILSQDDAREIRNTESESEPGVLYNTNFDEQLEAPDVFNSHNSDRDSTTKLSSTSTTHSNIESETSTLSASSAVDNSYIKHLATESKSENVNTQTTDEKCLESMQTSSQEHMTSDNQVYETSSLQTQNGNMGTGLNMMPTPRNESESGFFSLKC